MAINKNKYMVKYITLLLFLFGTHTVHLGAQGFYREDVRYRDSLRLQAVMTGSAGFSCYLSYPIGSSAVDESFGNNASELGSLRHFLNIAVGDTLLVVRGLSLDGYSSPDGSVRVNELLSKDRVSHLYDYLRVRVPVFSLYPTEIRSHGADWQKLRNLLESSLYAWRDEALGIIDGGESPERKKLWLAELGKGEAHRVLYDLYPLLRRVEVRVSYDVQRTREKIKTYVPPVEAPLQVVDTALPLPLPLLPLLPSADPVAGALVVPQPPCNPLFAVKTNLLFDVAMMPNVELEVPLGKRWSLNGEYAFAWWLPDHDKYCLQVLSAGVEARCWLGNRSLRRPLTGHFAGVYVAGGKYDLQWEETGYQGKYFATAGLTYGYSVSLSRRWNLEFSLGVGVLRTDYRHYHAQNDFQTLLWQKDGQYIWIGPTKAKISLVWLIGNRKGGRR